MKNDQKSKAQMTSAERSKRVFVKFSAVFLSCVLLVGVIFGAIGIVRNVRAVVKYKGIYLNEGVVNYLASSYKYDFMSALTRSGVEAYDSPLFWQSTSEDGVKWADALADGTERYIRRVVVGSYLFDKNTRLNSNDKAVISKAIEEVVSYRAEGSTKKFDEIGAEMGFTYKDFQKAAELLYKYEMAEAVIFGYDGSALESGGFTAECSEFFESAYSHVKLLIIRTDGELVTDETGKQTVSEYDDDKRAEVLSDIEEIRALIDNPSGDVDNYVMNEEAFDWYINKYKTGTVNDTEGYYFSYSASSASSYSKEFAKDAPEVVKLAVSMGIGHYAECELEFGVCFIYKCPLEENAYTRIALSHFFEDFYENASTYVYSKSVDVYIGDVTVKEKYDRNAVVTKPYNQMLAVKFG